MKPEIGSLKRSTKLTNVQQDGLRKRKTQITKIRNESGAITTDSTEIKGIISTMNNCTPTLDNLDEMGKSPIVQNLPGLDPKETENLSTPNKETEYHQQGD